MRTVTPLLVAAGLFVVADSALATPITSCYEVRLHTRFDAMTGPAETIDPITFLLYMTFDDQVTSGTGSPDGSGWQTQYYGAPTFSGIPLLAPSVPDDGWVSASETYTELTAYRGAPGDINTDYQQALAYQDFHFGTSSPTEYWHTRIGIAGMASGPWSGPLSVSSFLNLLNTGNDSAYEFFYSSRASRDSGGHALSYWGTVSAWDPSADAVPAPEPATLTLLGSGLAAAFLRARRRRSE